jgi:ABC-type nitrate/sulfonate/bicarbonate transport system substrate-binding protein
MIYKFFNFKPAFGIVIALFFIIPIFWVYISPWLLYIKVLPLIIYVLKPLKTSQFIFGLLQSAFASLIVVWAAYIWRLRIKKIFQPNISYVRAPIMLGIAPLIVGQKKGIWEKSGINLDLDFRYAGKSSLENLLNGDCQLAVASDIALCCFATTHTKFDMSILPFVRIIDHLKFIVRKKDNPEIKNFNDLECKRIGYFPNSVHIHFLNSLELYDTQYLVKFENILKCYHALLVEEDPAKKIDAFLLWEPHYGTFFNFSSSTSIVNDTRDLDQRYEWFLCLASSREYTNRNAEYATRILSAMKEATDHCRKKMAKIAEDCITFLHTEFTGVEIDELERLLKWNEAMDQYPFGSHSFGIDENMPQFKNKLQNPTNMVELDYGLARLIESPWPGISF